jgi:beta-RFAP synthase
VARKLTDTLSLGEKTFHLIIESAAPEHSGLGTGTQLALAVARAISLAAGREDLDVTALAEKLGRGRRSALGIHGFAQGGFLVDGGKGPETLVAPLIARLAFPEDWKVVLVLPKGRQGLHGLSESEAFRKLMTPSSLTPESSRAERQAAICQLVLLGLLPALAEHNLPAFGETLYEFNRRVGEMFRPLQGGTYSSELGAKVVEFIRSRHVAGVGQSSWGPAIFAVVEADRASWLAAAIRERFGFQAQEVMITRANNVGARAAQFELK